MSDHLPAPQNQTVNAGVIASWLGGTLALFGGLNALGVGYAGTGAALLAGALFAFPPAYNAIARTGLALPGWVRTGLFVIAAFAAAAMLPEWPSVPAPQDAAQEITAAPKPQPAPPPRAPTSPQPGPALIDLMGTGTQTTREFTTAGHDWDLHWKYDCSNIGADGSLIVQVMRSDGTATAMTFTETGSGTEDTEHFHRGGTFYLMVNTTCTWHVVVSDAP